MPITWVSAGDLLPLVVQKISPADVILDIGCGIVPQKLIQPVVHICCEPFYQYVECLQNQFAQAWDRKYLIMQATWEESVKIFPPHSVDSVFLLDVVEHLEKLEALRLIKATEQVVRKQIIIFTPLGFLPQCHPDGKDAWGLNGGSWQEHKSGWEPTDFDDSWEVFAAEGVHFFDSLGRAFDKPFGAIWAIKTV